MKGKKEQQRLSGQKGTLMRKGAVNEGTELDDF